LHSAVNRLREALGDSADNPRFIETLPRRGYRFIAPVTVVTPAQPAAPREAGARPETASANPASVAAPPVPVEVAPTAVPTTEPRAKPVGRAAIYGFALALVVAVIAVVAGLTLWRSRPAAGSGGKMTIAVLPFENLSGDPQQDYFSDGFTEEM